MRYENRTSLRTAAALAVLLFVGGCAWQRIPDAPEYTFEDPIPLKVGVILSEEQSSAAYGPQVISEWREMRLFKSLVYPYRHGDNVDAVMKLSITGKWEGAGTGAGLVTGLTLGLAGTAVGPSMTGNHDALAIIDKSTNEIGRYSVHVTSTVEWGMAANSSDVAAKADTLQIKRIAFELAKKIRADMFRHEPTTADEH